MRLIDADELLKEIKGAYYCSTTDFLRKMQITEPIKLFRHFMRLIELAPTVEAVNKVGYWSKCEHQPYDYEVAFICSNCHKEIIVPEHKAKNIWEYDKYCFNCGSKMIKPPETLIDKCGPVFEQIAEAATNFFEDETISGLLEEGEE